MTDEELTDLIANMVDSPLLSRHQIAREILTVLREANVLPVPGMDYTLGDKVIKPRGYPFPGTVVAAFMVEAGQRYVVESELAPGMLHIFSPSQLAPPEN